MSKLKKKLSCWRGKQLSFGGRICLVKSVLSALPLYFISFFKIPQGVEKSINQLMSRFLWGGSDEIRKISWVRWKRICTSKLEGGLGVRDLGAFNKALLGKWRWRMLHEHDQLWCRLLMAKYGDDQSSKVSLWWKDLFKVTMGDGVDNWFANGVSRRLGEGDKTGFWTEDWYGFGPLCVKFPELYRISGQQSLNLKEMGFWTDNKWVWDFKWSQSLEGHLQNQFDELLRCISSFSPVKGRKDSWVWIKESDGKYSVKSAYEAIAGSDPAGEEVFKLLWKAVVPSNSIALGWKALINRIQTKDNLVKRGISIVDPCCSLCSGPVESVDHLFLHCESAWQVWSLVCQWLGLHFVSPGPLKEHFVQFVGSNLSGKKIGFSLIWLVVIWQIWHGRNDVIFHGGSFKPEAILEQIKFKSWEWLNAKHRHFIHAVSEWFNEPMTCLSDM